MIIRQINPFGLLLLREELIYNFQPLIDEILVRQLAIGKNKLVYLDAGILKILLVVCLFTASDDLFDIEVFEIL